MEPLNRLVGARIEAINMKLVIIDPDDKGGEIRFTGGAYAGAIGWMDNSQKHPKLSLHVIVDKGGGKGYYTTVRKENVSHRVDGTSRLAKAIDTVPDIDKLMTALCRKLAQCGISESDPQVINFFQQRLKDATFFQEIHEAPLWYKIDNEEEEEEM